jgi:mannose-6-phosphate isomerase-like protein (cupin superfamily)
MAALDALPALVGRLTSDLPIDELERVEAEFKAILEEASRSTVSAAEAREIALFQQQVGFLLKYKPYAVKCASPLGYSIFLQNAGEGFSFQRHTEHKVEVFHILEVLPGGYAFMCSFEEWEDVYEAEAFARWLEGASDERYDRFRIDLSPGDVLVIDHLNVVHTILGCVVEEFATVSTDMVDRLHDQNTRAHVPSEFSREWVRERLRSVSYPETSRVVYGPGSVLEEPIEGGTARVLTDSFVSARAYSVEAGCSGPLVEDAERAASVYVTGGSGAFVLGDTDPIAVSAGDLLTILPGVPYRVLNRGEAKLTFSEHRIAPETAFVAT